MRSSPERYDPARRGADHPGKCRGFTLIEVVIGMVVLVVGVLGVAGMVSSGYATLARGGNMTMAVTAARQMLEEARTLPFANLAALSNLDTDSSGSQPAGGPEQVIARKWRYAIAGNGAGWNITGAEVNANGYQRLLTGNTLFNGRGRVDVASPDAVTRQVTVTVTVPGWGGTIQLRTLIMSM